jgi:hypothetical protein
MQQIRGCFLEVEGIDLAVSMAMYSQRVINNSADKLLK